MLFDEHQIFSSPYLTLLVTPSTPLLGHFLIHQSIFLYRDLGQVPQPRGGYGVVESAHSPLMLAGEL